MMKREGGRVWLDLDEYYPPPKQHPNTVFKSLAIAFQACGAATTYVDLMGVSAAAFRLQVGGYLCPSSPHPALGFSCVTLARQALGYELIQYEWDWRNRRLVKDAKHAVVQSIEGGRPAITIDEEEGLAVGYVEGGEQLLVRDPYSCRGDAPEELAPDWPGWGMATISKLPTTATRDAVIESLRTATMLATTSELLDKSYASGFAAYDRWVAALQEPTFVDSADTSPEAVVLGNAHIYYCLVDARQCAADYLRNTATRLLSEIAEPLQDIAEVYDRIGYVLDEGWEHVPWPWQLKTLSDWSVERRCSQATVLNSALELEREAVAQLDEAITSLA
jgi:hypothetical protein